jgi:hypothetical protein
MYKPGLVLAQIARFFLNELADLITMRAISHLVLLPRFCGAYLGDFS